MPKIIRKYRHHKLSGKPFFHMQILSVIECIGRVYIKTTGARYQMTQNKMKLIRRIDPKTNSVKGRVVGRLTFSANIGKLKVVSADKRTCIVQSDIATFTFNSDSLFFISCRSKNKNGFIYRHENLIENPIWNKIGLRRQDDYTFHLTRYFSRMWTDGYGGSLHACAEGKGGIVEYDDNSTLIRVGPCGKMAHMVFPPRFFEFDELYGLADQETAEAGNPAKPLVCPTLGVSSAEARIEQIKQDAENPNSHLNRYPCQYIILWDVYEHYHCADTGKSYGWLPVSKDAAHHETYCDTPALENVKVVHRFLVEPEVIKACISTLHENGFKVLVYIYPSVSDHIVPYGFAIEQSLEVTADWMKAFREEFGFDGYYFDYAGYGITAADNWYPTYRFIRRVRDELGDDGFIYHHNTIDVWGAWTGLRAIMVDAYCNAQLAGETVANTPEWQPPTSNDSAEVHHPDENYLRFVSSGYGLSQTIGSHRRLSSMRLALSQSELSRVMGENLHCIDFGWQNWTWNQERGKMPDYVYMEAHKSSKQAYLARSGDVKWPPNWFERITDAAVQKSSDNETAVDIT